MAFRKWFFWNDPQTPDEVRAQYFVNVMLAVGIVIVVLVLRYS